MSGNITCLLGVCRSQEVVAVLHFVAADMHWSLQEVWVWQWPPSRTPRAVFTLGCPPLTLPMEAILFINKGIFLPTWLKLGVTTTNYLIARANQVRFLLSSWLCKMISFEVYICLLLLLLCNDLWLMAVVLTYCQVQETSKCMRTIMSTSLIHVYSPFHFVGISTISLI